MVKIPPADAGEAGDMGSIPGWEDPMEKEMATHSIIHAKSLSHVRLFVTP